MSRRRDNKNKSKNNTYERILLRDLKIENLKVAFRSKILRQIIFFYKILAVESRFAIIRGHAIL